MTYKLVAAAVLTALVAGCGASSTAQFAPACPRAGILSDAADLARYRPGGGRDLTDQIIEGRITGINGNCSYGKTQRDLETKVTVLFTLTRGPAASPTREEDVSVFVALTQGETMIDKKIYPIHVKFPDNAETIRLTSPEIVLSMPISVDVSGAAYAVTVGFQLTPDELGANRAHRGR